MNPQLLPPVFPTFWASEWGEDEFGLYLDCNVNGIVQRFRWIVPGTFTMGSPENEVEIIEKYDNAIQLNVRYENETQHIVTLTQGFWLADSACTQALWQAAMGSNPAYFQDLPDHPVEQVSWDDVQQFIQAINTQFPDLQARLPTEAEWEYACRVGTTTPFSFGEVITSVQVNCYGEYPYMGNLNGLYRDKTVPVKSLPPNPWGLYEMHGNILEWCEDWYDIYSESAVVDPIGPTFGKYRVLRGGSWGAPSWKARSGARGRGPSDKSHNGVGFRLALGRKASTS